MTRRMKRRNYHLNKEVKDVDSGVVACQYKKGHTWKDCLNKKWGVNLGKEVNDDGELILYTIVELTEVIDMDDDATLVVRV